MCELIQNINWEFIIASIAIIISLYSIHVQRRHNILAYKPIPVVIKYNYSNHLSVKIWNKGTGPLIIRSLKVENQNNLIDLIPMHIRELKFVEYINDFTDRAITVNDHINMIEFKIRYDDNGKKIQKYENALQGIKDILNGKRILIEYTDIFNNLMTYTTDPLNYNDNKDELSKSKGDGNVI